MVKVIASPCVDLMQLIIKFICEWEGNLAHKVTAPKETYSIKDVNADLKKTIYWHDRIAPL